MSSTEVQLSERLPMLSATEEVAQSSPAGQVVVPVETTTVVTKPADVNAVPQDNNKFIQVIRPLLVELIGTALFVLIGLWGACSGGGVLATALSFGLALAVFSASFGHISGVHFNPSVTIGVLIAGEVQAVMAILYVVAQLLGGIGAAGLLRLLLVTRTYTTCKGGATVLTYVVNNTVANNGRVVATTVDYVRNWQGILIEAIATFVLVTVILMVALDTKSKTGLAPLLIGFALAVNILAIGAYTSGSLNPARSLGPAIFANEWEHHYVYWIGPIVGAIVAGFLYRTVWASNDRRMFVKSTKTTTTTTTTAVKQ
jgi:MIP family channel proteins